VSSTLLDPPPPRVAARPPLRPTRVPAPPRKRPRRDASFAIAIAVSALFHLILLVTLRFDVDIATAPGLPRTDEAADRPIGMRVYDIVAVEEPAVIPREPERPESRAPAIRVPAQGPTPTPTVTVPPAETPPRRDPTSLAERLRPNMADPRLWGTPGVPAEAPLDADDAVRARVANRLGAWNDSMRIAEEAAARATDWTVKDKDGGRWGVSPEGIHLGSFTLPLPIQLATPPGRRDAANNAARNWNEIQAQRSQAEIRESIEERIKAIRERKEAERRDSTRRAGGS
jgi:hypothetical protein